MPQALHERTLEQGAAVKVYLETNLWNALCDHPVDADTLVASLGSRGINLVFSYHCVTEMAKTFQGFGAAADRGRQLFSCLRRFVDAGARCAQQNMKLIPAELTALTSRTEVELFISANEHTQLKAAIGKLANGIFDETANRFIGEQIEFAKRTREGQISHLQLRPEMKQKLVAVSPNVFPTWLDEQVLSLDGQKILTSHIMRIYPDAPPSAAFGYARALLANPRFRFARGVVRADLYYNWRCAHRGSNRPDLIDDMFHVLNATYCDIYVTQEKNQIEYAGLLLSPDTRVEIYDGTPVNLWLKHLFSSCEAEKASA
jgi:hypothetical protein